MKTISKTFFLIAFMLLGITGSFAQKYRHGHARAGVKHRHARVVVKSPYRPAKVVVYHPVWRPAYTYHRRWVYFPRYNFYWDNWRQGYYYRNGTAWVFNTAPPPVIVNVKLENEKNYELKEDEDDVDDVYKTNDMHQVDYKAE